jgi:hypothetical protein
MTFNFHGSSPLMAATARLNKESLQVDWSRPDLECWAKTLNHESSGLCDPTRESLPPAEASSKRLSRGRFGRLEQHRRITDHSSDKKIVSLRETLPTAAFAFQNQQCPAYSRIHTIHMGCRSGSALTTGQFGEFAVFYNCFVKMVRSGP